MPRLILNSRYLAPGHGKELKRLVHYMGTRDGVDLPVITAPDSNATKRQKELVQDLCTSFPDVKKTLEYEDYKNSPTKGNASEFITFALELNADAVQDMGEYVRYMGHRPRVDKLGKHGLFSQEDSPIVLEQAAQEIAEHKGNVWSHVISLRREDADRLGYDHAQKWQALLRQEVSALAEHSKIPLQHLKWYAAMHNEGRHPHVHMLVYSTNPKHGFLTKAGIKNLKSVYANAIFENDLQRLYTEKTAVRDELKEQAKNGLAHACEKGENLAFHDQEIAGLLSKLSVKLQKEKGKKVYGYLSRPAKRMVDEIVERLSQQEGVAALYDKWCGLVLEHHRTYEDNPLPPVSLVENKEFRKIKNEVVRAALELPGMGLDEKAEPPEPELLSSEPPEDNTESESPSKNPQETKGETKESAVPVEVERSGYSVKQGRRRKRRQGEPYIEWTKEYKAARELLYGSEAIQKDTEKALKQMIAEAGTGNILAYHDVGLIYHNGMAGEPDEAKGQDFFQKAYAGFLKELDTADEESWMGYLEYRIGKLYSFGYGVEQDAKTAVSWFRKAAGHGNKYAQYSMGNAYRYGSGVEPDNKKAAAYYRQSAEQEFDYAQYALGTMQEYGIGVEQDKNAAQENYAKALPSFLESEKKTPDDKLRYRIGEMYRTGKGTEINIPAAVTFYEKAIEDKNSSAAYRLGRLLVEGKGMEPDLERGRAFLELAVEEGNANALYYLGKELIKGETLRQDIPRGVELLEAAIEQENNNAQYFLGKELFRGEHVAQDIPRGVELLEAAIEQDNNNAQYFLGKELFRGEHVAQDIPRGVELLEAAIEQDNNNAQYFLGKELFRGEHVAQDIPRGVKLLEAAVEQDNNNAQYFLGKELFRGEHVAQDIPRGAKLLEAAAEQGNSNAQYFLGKELIRGEHVAQDTPRGAKLLEAAAKQENPFAQYELGKIYLEGKGIPADISRALFWLEKSAGQDNTPAQYQLGKYYYQIQDYGRAEYWLNQAALKNDAPYAAVLLARLCIDTHRPQRAVQLLTAAAQGGYGPAAYQLGKLYLFGAEGIEADREQAIKWLQLGASQGDENSVLQLEKIKQWDDAAVTAAATALIRNLGKMIEENYKKQYRHRFGDIDKKVLSEKQKKKQALGIKDGMV